MNKKFYKDVTYVTNPHDVLVLVNKNNKLPSSFIPDNLVAINIMGSNEDYNKFEESVEFEWMKNNAHLYGFILRYPKGKENITGFKYEPWHYRYIGKKVATIIYNENITLEEYLKKLKNT